MAQTIAEQLNIKEFPFNIMDKNGNEIYYEDKGFWFRKEYDSNGNRIYYENSNGEIEDNRPNSPCDGKIVEIDGKKYKLTQI